MSCSLVPAQRETVPIEPEQQRQQRTDRQDQFHREMPRLRSWSTLHSIHELFIPCSAVLFPRIAAVADDA
jgi:hypothetical protein